MANSIGLEFGSQGNWDYFAADRGYSEVLRDRLNRGVEMDSALAMGRYLDQHLIGDLDIVDIGGGPGHYFPVIEKCYSGGSITYRSVDIDADNIRYGKEFFTGDSRVSFEEGSVLEPGAMLDGTSCVISANTLPHVPTILALLNAVNATDSVQTFLFRMLIGNECVEIRKHLDGKDFSNMFNVGFQHNNIYSLAYLESVLGAGWKITQLPDVFDNKRLASHSVPMQNNDASYGNRVSRPVGDMIFKGEIYMPWAFVLGQRI